MRRQWRRARVETGLDWVTPHTFRKTVATPIDKEANTKTVAAQLGHTSEQVTDTYYIAKPVLAPMSPTSSNNSALTEDHMTTRKARPARNRPPRAHPTGEPRRRRKRCKRSILMDDGPGRRP